MLLNAVPTAGRCAREVRARSCGRWRPFRGSLRAAFFRRRFALEEAGAGGAFEDLHARLEEADQNLLAEAVLAGRADSPEEVGAALESVRHVPGTQRRDQLKARMRGRARREMGGGASPHA